MNTAEYLLKLERDLAGGFLHLLVLLHVRRHEPIHGYGVIKHLDDATGGRGLWKEGTIYPVLGVLEKEGLVKSRWGKGQTGPRRKYYQTTPAGRQTLRLALAQWQDWRKTMDGLTEGLE